MFGNHVHHFVLTLAAAVVAQLFVDIYSLLASQIGSIRKGGDTYSAMAKCTRRLRLGTARLDIIGIAMQRGGCQ